MFYSVVPTLIVINVLVYLRSGNRVTLFTIGFMSGMLMAKILTDLGYPG